MVYVSFTLNLFLSWILWTVVTDRALFVRYTNNNNDKSKTSEEESTFVRRPRILCIIHLSLLVLSYSKRTGETEGRSSGVVDVVGGWGLFSLFVNLF